MKLNADKIGLLIIVVLAFFWVYPLLWILSLSLRDNASLFVSTDGIFVSSYTLDNFASIIRSPGVLKWTFNSFAVAVSSTIFTLILSSMGGYALAKLNFVGKKVIFIYIFIGMLIPGLSIVVPLYLNFADWGLHNSFTSLIVTKIAGPMGIFLMYQFFKAIPKEIEEAAVLDGANDFKIFLNVMLPMAKPALATLGIFTFLGAWNEYLWTLISSTNSDMYTLTVGIANMQTFFSQSEGIGFVAASAVVSSLPVIAIYVIFQKHILDGVSMSGDK